jgi:hypothetical protein
MNIIKVVVDGGWHIRESEMQEILSMVTLTEDVSGMSVIVGSNEKVIKNISEDVVRFFQSAMREFGCSLDLIAFIEKQKK